MEKQTEGSTVVWWRVGLLWGLLALAGLGCEVPGPARPADPVLPPRTDVLWRASHALPHWESRNDLRLLYVELRLRENTIKEDLQIVKALRHAEGIFTHMIFVAPSWQERPDAALNPIVQEAFRVCRQHGLGAFWGRWLWVGWPNWELEDPLPGPDSHLDATYYAAAISTLRAEARLLGAVGTFLDAEPNARAEQKPTLKNKRLAPEDRLAISTAIREAVKYAGQVDLLYPTSSNRASHYAWPLEGLARFRCDAKPYYQHKSSGKIFANPPAGYEHKLDLWGSFVTPVSRQIGGTGSTSWTLTIDDAKALNLDIIRQRYPECRGFWVYTDELVEVLREWGS